MRILLAALAAVLLSGCPRQPLQPPVQPRPPIADTVAGVCDAVSTVAGARSLVATAAPFLLGNSGQSISDALTKSEVCVAVETVRTAADVCSTSLAAGQLLIPEAGVDYGACGYAIDESPRLSDQAVLYVHAALGAYQASLLTAKLDGDPAAYGIACGVGLWAEGAANEAMLERTPDADGDVRPPAESLDPATCRAEIARRAQVLLRSHLEGA